MHVTCTTEGSEEDSLKKKPEVRRYVSCASIGDSLCQAEKRFCATRNLRMRHKSRFA
jgi:hypothetical protein